MPRCNFPRSAILVSWLSVMICRLAVADPPEAKGVFPAGGRRGTTVNVRILGCNFHDRAQFHQLNPAIESDPQIFPTETIWFEGPVIPQPASQTKEEYPQDYANRFTISSNAPLGSGYWKVSTSQGITASVPFVIGDLPEIVETEIAGDLLAVPVTLPVTINGRIFPREDIDRWSFSVDAGETVTCHVAALSLGSPLQSRLVVKDPLGKFVAESLSLAGDEAKIRFSGTRTGKYTVEIQDVNCGGLQNYVYRLTVTAGPHIDTVYPLGGRRGSELSAELTGANLESNRISTQLPSTAESSLVYQVRSASGIVSNSIEFDKSDLPELLEEDVGAKLDCPHPAVWNGRILNPGEVDRWLFQAHKGDELDFDLHAARLGTALDSVIQIFDSSNKLLVENDDLGNAQTDSRLRFTVPADGAYSITVQDRLTDRGGHRYGYRLYVKSAKSPSFQISLNNDFINLERGKTSNLKVTLDRGPGFQEDVTLLFSDLPEGVTVQPTVITKQQKEINLTFQADSSSKIQTIPIKVMAQTQSEGRSIQEPVQFASTMGGKSNMPLWLSIAMPTPFRFQGIFETKFMPRGSSYVRHYTIDRNGYTGPLEARLADQQGRHLQGVKGDPVTISPGENEFDFTVRLPSWMEIGRTSRTTLMILGKVIDHDGSEHVVSYSSNAQNDQMIALVDPEKMALTLSNRSLAAVAGQLVRIPFRLQRGRELKHPTRVEIVLPAGMLGVSAKSVTVPANQEQSELLLKIDENQKGPFLAPITIRATSMDEKNLPVISESPLELVPQRGISVLQPISD